MSFLRLVNIGKIYASESNVSVGIRKVNLAFDKGEFVAVTGKSGSGKTTLLNVISGLDSYEEGEMYIENNPTSHYLKEEWEEYGEKYISFIFQDYNILESFTVLENVEFALTSINDLKERKRRAWEIIERVGLKERASVKGIHLSGGEKQRTVIARAIAKDSPIILADEPTGNLDSKNSEEILRLLGEISKDKLVIVVTHNYEDVKKYATRHIRIYDGSVDLDERFDGKTSDNNDECVSNDNFEKEHKYIFRGNKKKSEIKDRKYILQDAFLLGVKRFTTRPKQNIIIACLLTITLVAIFMVFSLSSAKEGLIFSSRFINNMAGRVIVAQQGDKYYTDETAQALKEKYGADSYIMDDVYLDNYYLIDPKGDGDMWDMLSAKVRFSKEERMSQGRMPEKTGEVALRIPYAYKGNFNIGDSFVLGATTDSPLEGMICSIVGLDYYINGKDEPVIYMTRDGYSEYANIMRFIDGKFVVEVGYRNGASIYGYKYYTRYIGGLNVRINRALKGKEVILYDVSASSVKDIIVGGIEVGDTKIDVELKEVKPLNVSSATSIFALIEISPELFDGMSRTGSKQISLLFKDNNSLDGALAKMSDDGYSVVNANEIKIVNHDGNPIEKILTTIGKALLGMVTAACFSLMIILSLSRLIVATKGDIAIFRTMGIKSKVVKKSTYVQLFMALLPAVLVMIAVALVIYYSPAGIIFGFVGFGATVGIILSVIVLIAIIGKCYNRLLYREKIRKGLRRVNK